MVENIGMGEREMKFCNNCNQELPDESIFCNKCGNKTSDSIENKIISSQEVNNTDVIKENSKRSRSKLALIGILITVLIFGIGAGSWYYVHTKNIKEQEQSEKEYEQNIRNAVNLMIDDSSVAEDIVNSYVNAWQIAIRGRVGILIRNGDYENFDIIGPIAKNYAKNFGEELKQASSPENAIKIIKEIYDDLGKIDRLTDNKIIISDLVKSLNNPPEEFKTAYEIVFELYGYYDEYISMAESPSGNLVSFKENAEELPSEIIKKFKEFNVRLPSK